MIEHVVMDYEGEPVSIENGEMLWWEPDDGEHWNSETRKFERDEEENDNAYWLAKMREALAAPVFPHPLDYR